MVSGLDQLRGSGQVTLHLLQRSLGADLRRGNQLLVSYNVNSLDANTDLYADVSIYRPRFVGVTLTPAGAQ